MEHRKKRGHELSMAQGRGVPCEETAHLETQEQMEVELAHVSAARILYDKTARSGVSVRPDSNSDNFIRLFSVFPPFRISGKHSICTTSTKTAPFPRTNL